MPTMNQTDLLFDVETVMRQVADNLRDMPDVPETTGAKRLADQLEAARRVVFDVRAELSGEVDPVTLPPVAR